MVTRSSAAFTEPMPAAAAVMAAALLMLPVTVVPLIFETRVLRVFSIPNQVAAVKKIVPVGDASTTTRSVSVPT